MHREKKLALSKKTYLRTIVRTTVEIINVNPKTDLFKNLRLKMPLIAIHHHMLGFQSSTCH